MGAQTMQIMTYLTPLQQPISFFPQGGQYAEVQLYLTCRIHFQHSGAKIRVFEENTDIVKFWLFYSVGST